MEFYLGQKYLKNFIYQFTRPIIFAHRGASAYAPENTLAAFKLAIEDGADAIELDVKLSCDDEIVVIHDQTVNRTTDGHGDVRRLRLAELKQLNAGIRFDSAFMGEQIPTLTEVFETIGEKIYLNLELTNYATPNYELVNRVAAQIKKYHMENHVLLSSFLVSNLTRLKFLLPEVPRGMLAAKGFNGWIARSMFRYQVAPHALHPYFTDVTKNLILKQHYRNRKIFVWTINKEHQMKRLLGLGVDGIFTDDPRLACQILEVK